MSKTKRDIIYFSLKELEGLKNHLLTRDLNCGQTYLSNPKLQETKGLASIHQACRKAQISKF